MSSLRKIVPLSPRLCVWRGRSQISKHRCLITAKNICKHRSKSLCWIIPWTNLPSVSGTFPLVCPALKTPLSFYFSGTEFSLSALGAQSLSHWTTREVPASFHILHKCSSHTLSQLWSFLLGLQSQPYPKLNCVYCVPVFSYFTQSLLHHYFFCRSDLNFFKQFSSVKHIYIVVQPISRPFLSCKTENSDALNSIFSTLSSQTLAFAI